VAVANRIVGAEFQNFLEEHLQKRFKEKLVLYFKAFNQAGYLPGTVPPKGPAAQLEAAEPNRQAIIAQGGPQTNRQQKFVRDWLLTRSKLDGNNSS
jgi:hypothetical protein